MKRGFTHIELMVLQYLSMKPGRVSEIAREMNLSDASVCEALKKFRTEGLVNKDKQIYSLTEKGKEKKKRPSTYFNLLLARLKSYGSGLNEEYLAHLIPLLEKIVNDVEKLYLSSKKEKKYM